MSKAIINDNEIHLLGINRSGIHAITYWIMGHFNPEPMKLRRVSNFDTNFKWTEYHNMSPKMVSAEKSGDIQHKACLFFTHEDQHLKGFGKNLRRMKDRNKSKVGTEFCHGRSEKVQVVYVLRDPLNHFASIMQKHLIKDKKGKELPPQKRIVSLWVEFAREAIGETKHLPSSAVLINYNRWFTDQDYRMNLSSKLGLQFTDVWLNKVSQHGKGSSFDKRSYDGRAQEMDVLERWRKFSSDKVFLSLFNPEIRRLSRQLFNMDLP
jgi:hypothetical protein